MYVYLPEEMGREGGSFFQSINHKSNQKYSRGSIQLKHTTYYDRLTDNIESSVFNLLYPQPLVGNLKTRACSVDYITYLYLYLWHCIFITMHNYFNAKQRQRKMHTTILTFLLYWCLVFSPPQFDKCIRCNYVQL